MSNTSYTYNENTGDISFTLKHSITVSLATQNNLEFTLSDGGTFQQMGGSLLPGANGNNSFTVTTSQISGDFTINANVNSTHTVAFDGDATYNMKKFTIDIGNAIVSFSGGVKLVASDKIDIKTMRNIYMNDVDVATGSTQMLSGAKGVSLVANESGKSSIGTSSGIYIGPRNSVQVPMGGSGTIELSLKGSSDQLGVLVNGGNITNNVGTIMITGTGGSNIAGFNRGVNIQGSSTVKGNGVTIIGNGGANATGIQNIGIFIGSSCIVDAGAALASLTGTGGNGTSGNLGVNIQGSSTVKGNGITIIGNGGANATSTENSGIFIDTNSSIDAGTALASLTGTGGSGTDFNRGVNIQGSSTVKGNGVTITGSGGANATGTSNHGITVVNNAKITGIANDMMTNKASVTLNGTSGSGTENNRGIDIRLGGIVESTDGDVDITGLSMKTTVKTNHGIAIEMFGATTNVAAQVVALKGNIRLNGTGGGGIDSYGTLVDNSGIVNAKETTVVGKASSSYGVVQQNGGNFIGNVTIDGSSKEYFPNTTGQDINGNIIVESPLLIIIKSLGDNTQLSSSGRITLSKSRLIIDDSAHMSSDGDTYTIVSSGASIDHFSDHNDLSIVTGTSGQRYIIDYSTTKIMLIREFDFEPEPEPDCMTSVRIDLDLDLNISGQIRGQICLPRRLLC